MTRKSTLSNKHTKHVSKGTGKLSANMFAKLMQRHISLIKARNNQKREKAWN